MFTNITRFTLKALCITTLGFALSNPPKAIAADIESQDIILSSNGAAGNNDWEYNAAKSEGWVRRTIDWTPSGTVRKVNARCVDNCGDERKFQYRVKLVDGAIVLIMKATTNEPGLIRVQLNALTD